MTEHETLKMYVATARQALADAELALSEFEQRAEHFNYATLDDAQDLRDILRRRAIDDCEMAGECGMEEYEQQCYIDGVLHKAVLSVEYDRHDKTYYYVDRVSLKITKE